MAITKKDVEHVALLSRLALSEKEIELYAAQMAKILSYMEKLNALDTEGIEPTTYTISPPKIFRGDEVKPSYPQDEVLSNVPEKAKGCFRVPRIIE